MVDEGFDKSSWHGTTLLGSLRGMSLTTASWRPAPNRHNIWEIVVHAAYWKYAVRRRLTDDKRGSFPLKGSNWFARPDQSPDRRQWRDEVGLLVGEHRALRDAVARLSLRDLAKPIGGRRTIAHLVRGIAAHDLYHAGQIQLIKRLRR
jgi:hypothetical protein